MNQHESQIDNASGHNAAKTSQTSAGVQPPGGGEGQTLEDKVIAALREVYDPEIPVNIYDMGLIYEIQIDTDQKVNIKMTLTSPACPVAESLPGHVRASVSRVVGVAECDVELVWEPQWTPEKMTDAAKLRLGML